MFCFANRSFHGCLISFTTDNLSVLSHSKHFDRKSIIIVSLDFLIEVKRFLNGTGYLTTFKSLPSSLKNLFLLGGDFFAVLLFFAIEQSCLEKKHVHL